MPLTCHSEVGQIQSLFIKEAKAAFVSDPHMEEHWKQLNYLGQPSLEAALSEYAEFERVLRQGGATLYQLPEDARVNMDSIYCRDAAIATNQGMILCNMGKAQRSNEPLAVRDAFVANGFAVLGMITAPGTIEGGDVAWLDDTTIAVGRSYRTNETGILQLKQLLAPLGVEVIVVSLPHYKGPDDVFHLMSIFSPVDNDLAVIYSPLMPVDFRTTLIGRGYRFVEVPEQEFDSMGCNVLALAPRACMMVAGNPVTKLGLEKAGCKVTVYHGAEISVKGGGGPTCLTRPVYRYTDV